MDEIVFDVRKQADGWYLASPVHKSLGGATEAQDFDTLKQKIREFVDLGLSAGFHKEVNLPEYPKIRLIHSETLFSNPEAERVLITGTPDQCGYRAKTNTLLSLDLYHKNLEALREELLRKVQEQGHQNKHVEFRLEEVLQLTPDSSGD